MPFQPGNTLGRRWQPGQSGNPLGRSRVDWDLREAARAATPEALETIVAIMRDASVDPGHRLRAAELILNRAHGKPIAQHVIAASVEHTDATAVFVAALRAHAERLAAPSEPALLPAAE